MPDFDSGCYFLTALVPIGKGTCRRPNGTVTTPVNALREALAVLPTAHQSPASSISNCVSPFARDLRTHFARFAVIDDVLFNGRVGRDALRGLFTGVDERPEVSDRLSRPYLLFAAEFDAQSGGAAELEGWLKGLWSAMEPELRTVFEWCAGFETVSDAASFARWLAPCRIETTFPFHDYWAHDPPLRGELNATLVKSLATVAGVAALVVAVGVGLFGFDGPWGWVLSILLGLGLGVGAAYWMMARAAAKPYPTPPEADLGTVLKALYLQQRLAHFAEQAQGVSPADLHQRFGRFLQRHRPDQPRPTQPPGVTVTQGALKAAGLPP